MTPKEAQAILDSRSQAMPDITPEMAKQVLAERLGSNPNAYEPIKHIAAGVTKFGQNMANLPNNITHGAIPEFSRKSFDPYQTFGVQEGLADKIGAEVLGFLPFGKLANMAAKTNALRALPGSEMLKTNILGGAGYGAVNNPENRLLGAAEGGGIGVGAHGLGLAASAAGNAIYNSYAKSAIPALVDKATQYIRSAMKGPEYADVGAQSLRGAHASQKGLTDNLWAQAESKASALDNASMRLDASPYTKTVENFIKEKGALEPAKGSKYADALEFAKEEAKNLAPQSFSGVIALRQNLNEILGNFARKKNLDAPSREMKEFAKDLKFSLNDVVNAEGKGATPELKDFYKTWTDANKATTRLKEFYQSPDKYGTFQPNKSLEGGLKAKTAEGSLMNEYLPFPAQTGAQGYEHLSGLLGSREAAKQGLRNYEFRNLGNKKDALDFYQPLSPAQREVMFDKDASGLLSVANEAAQRFYPKGRESEGLFKQMAKLGAYHLLPGAVAGAGAYGTGHDARTALGIGAGVALGGKGLTYGLGAYAAKHPESVLKAMRAAETPAKRPGQLANPLFQSYLGSNNK